MRLGLKSRPIFGALFKSLFFPRIFLANKKKKQVTQQLCSYIYVSGFLCGQKKISLFFLRVCAHIHTVTRRKINHILKSKIWPPYFDQTIHENSINIPSIPVLLIFSHCCLSIYITHLINVKT